MMMRRRRRMMMGLVVTSSICSCSVTAPILSSRPTYRQLDIDIDVKWHYFYLALLTPSDFSDRENLFWWNNDSDLLFSPLLRRLCTTFLQVLLLISGRVHSQCYDRSKIVLKKNIFIFAYIYHHDKMLLPTVNHLIFPRMLMCASLKLAKPAPHSLVLARMEACVVIIVILIELDAWCDTCGDFHQPHKSPTSSSASFDDQLWSQTPL